MVVFGALLFAGLPLLKELTVALPGAPKEETLQGIIDMCKGGVDVTPVGQRPCRSSFAWTQSVRSVLDGGPPAAAVPSPTPASLSPNRAPWMRQTSSGGHLHCLPAVSTHAASADSTGAAAGGAIKRATSAPLAPPTSCGGRLGSAEAQGGDATSLASDSVAREVRAEDADGPSVVTGADSKPVRREARIKVIFSPQCSGPGLPGVDGWEERVAAALPADARLHVHISVPGRRRCEGEWSMSLGARWSRWMRRALVGLFGARWGGLAGLPA